MKKQIKFKFIFIFGDLLLDWIGGWNIKKVACCL